MLRTPFFLGLIGFLSFSCDSNEPNVETQEPTPSVYSNSTFEVITEHNVVYGQGLSHEDLNSQSVEELDLELDVYYPDNQEDDRPAFVFIHGGGFIGGSKQQDQIVGMANYFASRGWVFISVDYRLLGDKGTVPQEWIDYSAFVPAESPGQFLAIYPAVRDAKAAMRWVVANADNYNINTDHITVGGGSAGAVTAIALGVTDKGDYRDEIANDPTLSSTNLNIDYEVKTIINFWGSGVAADILEIIDDQNRFDSNDPPLLIAHGTSDPTVLFEEAVKLESTYKSLDIPLAFYPFEGVGHGAWNEEFEGKGLDELTFDFIVEQQKLRLR